MGGSKGERGQVRFGTAGWSYADWAGPVYPQRGERISEGGLELLSRHFDLVEINATFYRIPTPDLARAWLRKVAHNPTFRFTAKLWNGFTHTREFGASEVRRFREGMLPFVEASRLGALLIQLPWSFKFGDDAWRHLDRIWAAFSGFPLVVEFRHRGWDRPQTLQGLKEANVGFCNIDQPTLRDCLGPTEHVTSEIAYVRLHGRNGADWFRADAGRDRRYDYRYPLEELSPWGERIRRIAARAREVYVVTNNHFGGSAVANALALVYLHRGSLEPLPARWLTAFPELHALGAPAARGQLKLFV